MSSMCSVQINRGYGKNLGLSQRHHDSKSALRKYRFYSMLEIRRTHCVIVNHEAPVRTYGSHSYRLNHERESLGRTESEVFRRNNRGRHTG